MDNTKNQESPFKALNLEVRQSDMYQAMKEETINFISNVFLEISEKAMDDYHTVAQNIKNYMDKQFGPPWHCIVGKGFGSGVTYNNKNMIFLYICNKAILIFRH